MTSSPDLARMPLAVVVAHSTGCAHCLEYLPIVRQVAPAHAGKVPVVLVDIAMFPTMIDALQVEATPTTVVLRYGRVQDAQVGVLDATALDKMLRGLA